MITPGLRLSQLFYFAADPAELAGFYRQALGWRETGPAAAGGMTLDVGGSFKLGILPSRTNLGLPPEPFPERPLLCLESADLRADVELLRRKSCATAPLVASEASPDLALLTDCDDTDVLVCGKVQGDVPPPGQGYPQPGAPARYRFAECLFFTQDLPRAERYYTSRLGFAPKLRQGDFYTALEAPGGYILGLRAWSSWLDAPTAGEPPAPPRLCLEAANLAAEHRRLVVQGVTVEPLKGNPNQLQWFTFHDPAGNPVTLWQYGAGLVKPQHIDCAVDFS